MLHGTLNSFGVRLVALLNNVSVWWHIIGVLIIVGVLAFAPAHHQSASFVFTHFVNNTGWSSAFYVVLLGLLLAQYTFTGYDASAHMTEETKSAAVAGPRGIVMSIIVSLVAGWILLIGVTFAIQHYTAEVGRDRCRPRRSSSTRSAPPAASCCCSIVIVAQLFCGMSSVTANSRMIYAFSRDGALPGSAFWHKVNPRTRTPTNGVWLAAGGRAHPGPALPVEQHRVRRGHLDRGHRPVRRLRAAHVPAAAARLGVQPRSRGTSAAGRGRSGSSR